MDGLDVQYEVYVAGGYFLLSYFATTIILWAAYTLMSIKNKKPDDDRHMALKKYCSEGDEEAIFLLCRLCKSVLWQR